VIAGIAAGASVMGMFGTGPVVIGPLVMGVLAPGVSVLVAGLLVKRSLAPMELSDGPLVSWASLIGAAAAWVPGALMMGAIVEPS
jgi:hypothetical protein